jgi:hypothetical protein
MINFPKPFDWFQKKVWRLYWVEWFIIFFILWANWFVEELIVPNYPRIALTEWFFSVVFCVIMASCSALPMALVSKNLLHFLFEIIHALFLIPLLMLPCDFKVGDFKPIHMVLDLLERVLKFIGGLNSKYVVSRFITENPSKDAQGIYGGKIGESKINIITNGSIIGELNINSKNEIDNSKNEIDNSKNKINNSKNEINKKSKNG